MTAAAHAQLVSRSAGDELATLKAALRQEFLAEAGWDRAREVLARPHTNARAGQRGSRPEMNIAFSGLTPRVQVELLLGLQHRNDRGVSTEARVLRQLIVDLRALNATSAERAVCSLTRGPAATLLRTIVRAVRGATASPETERTKDVWHLDVFGLPGRLDFTGISQPWLRESAKRWVEYDLPRHRGEQASITARKVVAAVVTLSESLRLGRDDRGVVPAMLGRSDIQRLVDRLAYQERTETLTARLHHTRSSYLRVFLREIRSLGLTEPGGPAAGLPYDVTLGREDIPAEPQRDAPGRALPDWVLAVINNNLAVLERLGGINLRRVVELLIDTGRRPIEVCRLPLACLERDAASKPILVYADFKNNRAQCRLPINETTAQIILDQQELVRQRFAGTPVHNLVLFHAPEATPPVPAPSRRGSCVRCTGNSVMRSRLC